MPAVEIHIRGVVQGVGFRPFVYQLAHRYEIRGWIFNDPSGVTIHAEGDPWQLEALAAALTSETPLAARIDDFRVNSVAEQSCLDFVILASAQGERPTTLMSPDLAVCTDCLRELADANDRRAGYPYINCTQCGPRYSIIRRLPYDRPHTTMADWPMCVDCAREYADPRDRRYHAQPTACPVCGPHYLLEVLDSPVVIRGNDAILRAADLLRDGAILGIKGIGGYHLACSAKDAGAVQRLRERKFRKEKPFALMAQNLDHARQLVELGEAHEQLLTDPARPIVVATAQVHLPGVAPDAKTLGVMLPYTPLHVLLFAAGAPAPLVLTSANRSSEPITYEDAEARTTLSAIADAFLVGERPIARRVEDSVVTVQAGQPAFLRRSRGYTPGVVATIPSHEPILALGADLKNSIALAVDGQVLVSQYLGDLEDAGVRRAFAETVNDLLAMYGLDIEQVHLVHDLHPGYHSSQFANQLPARSRLGVQHHHAHLASVLAEAELWDEPVVGIIYDGTGYGLDGSIWGGEIFAGSLRGGFERTAWLRTVQLPGGDAAAKFPVQAAAGFLAEQGTLPNLEEAPFRWPRRFRDALQLVHRGVRCFPTTSMGRLFDTVAALCGFDRAITFEGQAAIWLETLALQATPQAPYPFPELDHRPLLAAVVTDRLQGRPTADIAYAFHAAVATESARLAERVGEQFGSQRFVVSGGVFQNQLLTQLLLDNLGTERVLLNRQVPANDGGISLGQVTLRASGGYTSHQS